MYRSVCVSYSLSYHSLLFLCLYIFKDFIVLILFNLLLVSFSHQLQQDVFHWNMSDSKLFSVSRIFLCIQPI